MLARLDRLSERLAALQRQDPVLERVDGAEDEADSVPREWLYAQRMVAALAQFRPDAPELVAVAVRCQHLRRWEVERSAYPEGRKGYLKWRSERARRAAEVASEVMRESGYDADEIQRVQQIVQKHRLSSDPDVQLLEDVVCLVFLTHYFEPFAAKHEDDKVVDIVRKTWAKMSEPARRAALALSLSPELASLVQRALQTA